MRPQVEISEFAETVWQNLNYIEENIGILDQRSIFVLVEKTKEIEHYLAVLDTKQHQETDVRIINHLHFIGTFIFINIMYIYLYIVSIHPSNIFPPISVCVYIYVYIIIIIIIILIFFFFFLSLYIFIYICKYIYIYDSQREKTF